MEGAAVSASVSIYMKVPVCPGFQGSMLSKFLIFSNLLWQMASDGQGKTCTEWNSSLSHNSKNYLYPSGRGCESRALPRRLSFSVFTSEGAVMTIGVEVSPWVQDKGSQRPVDKEVHSKSRTRDFWINRPRNSLSCHISLLRGICMGWAWCLLCVFHSSLLWKMWGHLSSAFSLTAYWVNSTDCLQSCVL